jgi:heterodisulfide reductase subunit A-like polyferredoxin
MSGYEMGIGDVAHSRYILNFGANPYETHFLYVPFIQRLIDARVNLGAKLVTFDVRISQTAGKSDEWFPVIPGTDGMVVLAMAMVKADGVQDLLKKLKISTDIHGFLAEAHPKLRPVESLNAGFYLAGCAHGPKDIPETVAQASAAAAKVGNLFAQKELVHEPTVVPVNDELCSGCGICVTMCPYTARTLDPDRGVVVVNEILCEGCGACAAACPSGAAQQRNQTDDQIFSMLRAMLRE